MSNHLDFEKPIVELQQKVDELKKVVKSQGTDVSQELNRLEDELLQITQTVFKDLTPWQMVQLARHPDRPHTKDYIELIFDSFDELHGDRAYADDKAIIGGLASLSGQSVMVIGQQKGRDTKAKLKHNFGMPKPEGYRKALRLMRMAEKFGLPIVTFIDTPGAYPGIDAEQRGQSQAIAQNLLEMCQLRTPIISVVIGEGGSGGALAIGIGDRLAMLQYSTYSVISPEGCASILWKDAAMAPDAAKAMGVTADKLFQLGIVDAIVDEPLGGGHRDKKATASALKQTIQSLLDELMDYSNDVLLAERHEKIQAYGAFKFSEK